MADHAPVLFRAGLLEDCSLVVAGGSAGLGDAVADSCAALGARVERFQDRDLLDEAAIAARLATLRDRDGRIDALVIDCAALFAGAEQQELEPLRAATDGGWIVARAVATELMIPARAGKIVLLAPRPRAGPHATATRAALENMARTLSIEWSRHGICITTIAPGATTAPSEVGALVAYLASRAGEYFSGCVFELGAVKP